MAEVPHAIGLKAATAALKSLKRKPFEKTVKRNGDIDLVLYGETHEHLAQVAVEAYLDALGMKP